MATPTLRHLDLFSGYGGTSLGLKLALGNGIRTVARVERDSYAAATLVARMEDQTLDHAPVWDDVHTFDGRAWRGRVDLISGGFPCQPWSAAGLKGGVDDDRWLWPEIARLIAEVGPRFVFLENVPGLNASGVAGGGLPHVLQDLADLGFDAEWGLHSAADVGAPHKRQRFWLLAVAHDDLDGRESIGRQPEHDGDARSDVDRSGGPHVADTSGPRWDERRRQAVESSAVGRRGPADGGFPPRPDDTDGWERWTAQGGPQPSVRRVTDGRPAGLADALHLGGNGLVPRVAASAFAQLAVRLGLGRIIPDPDHTQ